LLAVGREREQVRAVLTDIPPLDDPPVSISTFRRLLSNSAVTQSCRSSPSQRIPWGRVKPSVRAKYDELWHAAQTADIE